MKYLFFIGYQLVRYQLSVQPINNFFSYAEFSRLLKAEKCVYIASTYLHSSGDTFESDQRMLDDELEILRT